MQPGERELHLGLHARGARDVEARGALRGVLQQRGLADAGLAAQDQDRALARSYACQLPVQHLALAAAASQHPSPPVAAPVTRRRSYRQSPIAGCPGHWAHDWRPDWGLP